MEDKKSLHSLNYYDESAREQKQINNPPSHSSPHSSPKDHIMRELKDILASTEISAKEFLELWTAFDTDGGFNFPLSLSIHIPFLFPLSFCSFRLSHVISALRKTLFLSFLEFVSLFCINE